MKRLLSVILILTLISTGMAGCQSKSAAQPQPQQGSSQGDTADAAQDVKPSKPVKYKIMLNQAISEYPPDGGAAKKEILKKLEQDLGITNMDYEVTLIGGSDYDTKLNALLASGDVPDYFEIKVDNLQSYVSNKVIAPIDDYLSEMPNYSKLLESDPIVATTADAFSLDGKQYGFVNGGTMPGYTQAGNVEGLIIRTDWLEKLGMSKPKTLDELHDVLLAFSKNDPDGNGQNDTYGFGGDKGKNFKSVFGAYGIYLNGINSWAERDGKLVHSTVLPETKEVLSVLQNWYKEGIIDPDMFVIQGKQSKDKFISGKIGAFEQTIWWANDARVAWKGSSSPAGCAVIALESGPNGTAGYSVPYTRGNVRVLSKKLVESGNAEQFIKILDWMADDSEKGGLKLVQFGLEGTHYTYDAQKDFIDQKINDYVDLYKEGFSNPVRWLSIMDNRWIPKDDPRMLDLAVTGDTSKWIKTGFIGSVPAMKDYPDLYEKLWKEYFTKIVTGALSVDAFDEYTAKFEKQGGKELTEQVNAAWAEMK